MSLTVTVKITDNLTVSAEGTHEEIFSALASAKEVFSGHQCGKCGNKDLNYKVRKVMDGKKELVYCELQCSDWKNCGAKLTFGKSKDEQTIFPIRWKRVDGEYVKDANGRNIPKGKNGWTIYNKETQEEE